VARHSPNSSSQAADRGPARRHMLGGIAVEARRTSPRSLNRISRIGAFSGCGPEEQLATADC
jgi:hypothetical protein